MVITPEKMTKLEFREITSRLENKGLGPILRLLMERDSVAYTKKGRLNKSAICRKLHMGSKELDESLNEIQKEFSL